MPHPSIIAIDGPAASGKTSIGKQLADYLGYLFFDTGVLYRAITWVALRGDVEISDEAAITALAETSEVDVRTPSKSDGRNSDILVDGQDVTWEIRRPEVDANVSQVSAYPGVRLALIHQQRRIGQRGKVVMTGRDIGTVVLPEADLKIFLDASVEERAKRRYKEIIQRGDPADLNEIQQAMLRRDRIDSTRTVAPLRPADDAIILNTDQMSQEHVFQRLIELCKEST
jgi:cytidylate kinase